jgi:hypothetical protein
MSERIRVACIPGDGVGQRSSPRRAEYWKLRRSFTVVSRSSTRTSRGAARTTSSTAR